jgi:hypothetical protein
MTNVTAPVEIYLARSLALQRRLSDCWDAFYAGFAESAGFSGSTRSHIETLFYGNDFELVAARVVLAVQDEANYAWFDQLILDAYKLLWVSEDGTFISTSYYSEDEFGHMLPQSLIERMRSQEFAINGYAAFDGLYEIMVEELSGGPIHNETVKNLFNILDDTRLSEFFAVLGRAVGELEAVPNVI